MFIHRKHDNFRQHEWMKVEVNMAYTTMHPEHVVYA